MPTSSRVSGLLLASLVSASLGLTACGGSSTETIVEETPNMVVDNGQLQLIIRDAADDYLTYAVDIVKISLTRDDGTQIEVLPNQPRVDFVEYQTLSEFFSIQTVPQGKYTAIEFTLDYSDAEIVINDDLGNPVLASAVDSSAAPLTIYNLSVELDEREALVVAPGVPATLTLDFDLAASNTILTTSPAVVEVTPVLIADAQVDQNREHRVRGLLSEVLDNSITVDIKPFRFKEGEFGQMDMFFTDTTQYEVNGVEYTALAGIDALKAMEQDAPIVAYGQYVSDEEQWQILNLLAGSSVPWSGQDLLRGVATAHDNNLLSVKGVVIEPEDKRARFFSESDVVTGELTKVTSWHGKGVDIPVEQLAVGSKIQVLGQWQEAEEARVFNAEDGVIRIKQSQLVAQVTQVEPLQVSLFKANSFPIDWFSWADNSSSPESFRIDSQSLAPSLAVDDWLQLRGDFVKNGEVDFTTNSIIKLDLASQVATLRARSVDGESVVSLIDSELVLTEASQNVLKLSGTPRAVTAELVPEKLDFTDNGVFVVKHSAEKSIQTYSTKVDLLAAITGKLEQGDLVQQLNATGNYLTATGSLVAERCVLVFK